MEQVQTIHQSNVVNMNMVKIRLSGILAEVIVRSASAKTYNRNSGRKSKHFKLQAGV